MDTAYIQFQVPKRETKKTGDSSFKRSIRNFAATVLTHVLPKANPDFDDKIDDVEYWLIECEADSGIPQREIGLDQQGRVIMKMPFKGNYGYWTDNNLLLSDFNDHFEVAELSEEEFEQKWTLLAEEKLPPTGAL